MGFPSVGAASADRGYLRGLLTPLERKEGWTPAEQAGELCPDGMQRLLNQADWAADAVRAGVVASRWSIWAPGSCT
uniref:transposase n=1 Tax=Streptomyces azureus TaxID=146537 RepID=UPI0011DF6A93